LQSIIFGYDNETPPLSLCACALVAGAMKGGVCLFELISKINGVSQKSLSAKV